MHIRGLHFAEGHCNLQIVNHTPHYSKSPIELIIVHHIAVHILCRQMDLCWRQPVWLQQVGCLACNNSQMTMWEHQIIMLETNWTQTLNPGNPQIMTPSSQQSSSATEGYPSYGPSWQPNYIPQCSFCGPWTFPPKQSPRHGPSSPDATWVPPSPPGNNTFI